MYNGMQIENDAAISKLQVEGRLAKQHQLSPSFNFTRNKFLSSQPFQSTGLSASQTHSMSICQHVQAVKRVRSLTITITINRTVTVRI